MFEKLLGQERAKRYLVAMIEKGTVPSTLLFAGPEGVGKKLAAKLFTKALMGEGHFHKLEEGTHPDFHFFVPEGKAHMHPIENMRELAKEAQLSPFEAPCKVLVVEDADRMLETSSNALLKTLEEPLLTTHIILLSAKSDALLPTIVSRAVQIPFTYLKEGEIAALLPEGADPEVAEKSCGSMQRALLYLDRERKELREELLTFLQDKSPAKKVLTLQRIEEKLSLLAKESDYKKEAAFLIEELFFQDRTEKMYKRVEKISFAVQQNVKLSSALALDLLPN